MTRRCVSERIGDSGPTAEDWTKSPGASESITPQSRDYVVGAGDGCEDGAGAGACDGGAGAFGSGAMVGVVIGCPAGAVA